MLLIAVGLTSSMLSAQFRYRPSGRNMGGENYHFAYVSGGMGYSSMVENLNEVDPSGGFGWNLGAGYEFRNNGFWLSLGIGVGQNNSPAQVSWANDVVYDQYRGIDRNGNRFMPVFHDLQQQDSYQLTFVDIPLLLGYYRSGFYIGVGPKVGFGVRSKTRSMGTYELRGRYESYASDLYNIPEMGYTTYDFKEESTLQMSPLISICGEVGYDVLSLVWTKNPMCNILKIGFYFEYGLNTLLQPLTQSEHLVIKGELPRPGKEYDMTQTGFRPYLGSCTTDNPMVFPFYTGLRITYMFGGSQEGGRKMMHKGCQCYDL